MEIEIVNTDKGIDMDQKDGKEKVKAFILKQFPLSKKSEFNDETLLIETGILDSLGVLDLVSFLESEFSITIVDEELVPENFNSVEQIAVFLASKAN